MPVFRILLAIAACGLMGAAPAGAPLDTSFQRLSHGRVTRATLPPDIQRVAIYYGASWCGPCRAFVPDLTAAYPALRARRIEVLFVSDDATCGAALDYARTSRMPWLLLPCEPQLRSTLRELGGRALPGIVVVDRTGVPIDTELRSDDSRGPRRVLAMLLKTQMP